MLPQGWDFSSPQYGCQSWHSKFGHSGAGHTGSGTRFDKAHRARYHIYPPVLVYALKFVLVSGFSGWGEAIFGTINYWGGFGDIPTALLQARYTVIVVRIGPLSSNWERACEVYRQLSSGYFFRVLLTARLNMLTDGKDCLTLLLPFQRLLSLLTMVRYTQPHMDTTGMETRRERCFMGLSRLVGLGTLQMISTSCVILREGILFACSLNS